MSYHCLFTDSSWKPDDPWSRDLKTEEAADKNDITPAALDLLELDRESLLGRLLFLLDYILAIN